MIKKNNKGFTLLELLISIFILTTVIFIGYRVINKSTIDIKNQSNINKGQLTMNDMNEYLTKDLEQASSIALFLNNEKIADTLVEENGDSEEKQNILSDKIRDLENELNKLSIGNKFDYSYAIRFKNDENNAYSRKYKVEITKSNYDYKYSILREENNGIKISFINNSVLKEKELPFLIEGDSPYKVTLGYTSKDNSFTKHEFTITYRLNNIITTNTTNPPENEVVPPQVDDLNGDLIFELTKNTSSQGNTGQYDWNAAVKYNMLGNTSSKENTQSSLSEFKRGHFNIFLNNSSDKGEIKSHIMGNSVEFSDERLKNIIGMKIKLEGNIEITEFKIENFNNAQNINLTDTEIIYEFKEFSKAQRNIQGYINILPNEEIGDTSRIIIDFIYEE